MNAAASSARQNALQSAYSAIRRSDLRRSSDMNARARFVLAVLVSALIAASLVACAQDVGGEVLTTDDRQQVQGDVTNSTSLSDAEKTEFSAALQREGYQPYGKTVSRIITQERAYESAQAAAQAERARSLASEEYALDRDIKISPAAITIEKGSLMGGFDFPMNDVDTFTFDITNEGGKAIAYFSASATLENQGGDTLFDGTLENADGLSPGQTRQVSVRETFTGAHFPMVDPRLVRNTSIDDTVVQYSLDRIDFADGTRALRTDLGSE